jgi:hypothetical protein
MTIYSSKFKPLQINLTPAKKGMSTVNASVKIFQVIICAICQMQSQLFQQNKP